MNKIQSKQLFLYVLSIIVLFAIPISTIVINSDTLKDGTEFLFKVEAYDPYDIFRGNYLNIRFEEDTATYIPASNHFEEDIEYRKNECFVTIKKNKDGFAYFDTASLTKPTNTSDYYKTTGYYRNYENLYEIDTPTRYYMNENKSEKAEQLYRQNLDNVYVKVRVKNGKMVLVGVYVNNVLIDSVDM